MVCTAPTPASFCLLAKPSPQKPGYGPEGETGLHQCVRSGEEMAPGADIAGYEILQSLHGLLCESWPLERQYAEKMGVTLNHHGFIGSYEDAVRCTAINRETGGTNPGLWLPWLIAIYDATVDAI